MVIGLILAPVGVNMAMGKTGDGSLVLVDPLTATIIFLITLAVAVLISLKALGMFRLVPILIAIIVGYITSMLFGIVDLTPIKEAS